VTINPQTEPLGGVESHPDSAGSHPDAVESLLAEARARTLALVEPVSDPDLNRVHDPLMSPLVWDLGHIAAFEDLWVSREAGVALLRPELAVVYDAEETPRPNRGALPYLRRAEAVEYMAAVRERTAAALGGVSPFIAEMLIQHEHQHNETMLQTLQLAAPGVYEPERPAPPRRTGASGTLLVGPGRAAIGDAGRGFAYDNERPRHEVDLAAFRIDRAPVTNAAFEEFVADGGYTRSELWRPEGWERRTSEGWERPLYWTGHGGVRRFDRTLELEPDLPVMHVSWFEADAFARWRGARLPTEFEWEWSAALAGTERGNLDQLDFGPGPAGPFIGDCWEWTASEFDGYPGFEAYPYREYSQVFFRSGMRVLRGASWSTRPRVARPTFRNWDLPERRQIFCGFRCVQDG
jgi:gamma-glutamyl hercynylcysteine S-oxide synthase